MPASADTSSRAQSKPQASSASVREKPWIDRTTRILFFVGLTVIAFIAGAFAVEFKFPIYTKVLQPSFVGLRAYHEKETTDWTAQGWYKPREKQSDTTTYL